MFSKVNILLSKRLQKLLVDGGVTAISGLFEAVSIHSTLLTIISTDTGRSLIKNFHITDREIFDLFSQSSRIEVYVDMQDSNSMDSKVEMSFFTRGQKNPFRKMCFRFGGNGESYYSGSPICLPQNITTCHT